MSPEHNPISPDSGLGACTENPAKAESDKNPAPSHSGAGDTPEIEPMNDVYSPSFESKMDPKFQLDDASRKVYDP